ncbi:hypothetical protein ACN4EE_18485 [Geminocystis sp. CENA526]|uniref:hypothetical protein n=1 Tax=Geminocystis sp. CENA526 TaxID=1355871 RepID=UPI003D6FE1BB
MLLDSNIIIYATQIENEFLREFIAINCPYISALSYVDDFSWITQLKLLNPFDSFEM